jgi:F0F1-type ATP synthase gamma subunit
MSLSPEQQELRVDPVRVIQSLKQRLTEEIAKSALLEAALAESQERERALGAALSKQQDQDS